MIYKIDSKFLKVEINSMGAELWSVVNKNDGIEHLWQGDRAVWARRSPILFPYCGRLKDNKYNVGGEVYKGSLHGFARDYEHEVFRCTSDSIVFVLCSNEQTIRLYPYEFKLYTEYRLEGNSLHCSFKVENTNDYEMPFSIGYHTGLMCPFDNTKSIENYSLVFEKKETPVELLCNEEGFLSGKKKIFFNNEDTINLYDGFFKNSFVLTSLESDYISIVEKRTGNYVKVGIKNFPYVVLWSAPGAVKFVCIEPCYGLPDSQDTDGEFTKKLGIQRINPNKSFSCTQTIEIGRI